MQQAIANQDCSTLPIDTFNQAELRKICPPEFFENNAWSDFIRIILYRDEYDENTWDWISPDKKVQQKQFRSLSKLMHSDKILYQNRLIASAWYLSQILKTVPTYGNK